MAFGVVSSLCLLSALFLAPATAPIGSSPSVPSSGWLNMAARSIESSEYEVTRQRRGPALSGEPVLQAANRGQDLRAWFLPKGIDLASRTGSAGSWSARLSLRGVEPVAPEASGITVVYRHPGLLERWDNGADGFGIHLE